ncbi:hypothetical protein MF1_11150 [Bartonella quintana]|uniref:hypothetical protein n=1 Tax=Bartonella quintana TaxID=803 RepID=UPI0013193EC9|nr:hypothetical protein [Bartonella quintana]BBL53857.1 hypothetical protein MF1_11150 [Bartonella quintana]
MIQQLEKSPEQRDKPIILHKRDRGERKVIDFMVLTTVLSIVVDAMVVVFVIMAIVAIY